MASAALFKGRIREGIVFLCFRIPYTLLPGMTSVVWSFLPVCYGLLSHLLILHMWDHLWVQYSKWWPQCEDGLTGPSHWRWFGYRMVFTGILSLSMPKNNNEKQLCWCEFGCFAFIVGPYRYCRVGYPNPHLWCFNHHVWMFLVAKYKCVLIKSASSKVLNGYNNWSCFICFRYMYYPLIFFGYLVDVVGFTLAFSGHYIDPTNLDSPTWDDMVWRYDNWFLRGIQGRLVK